MSDITLIKLSELFRTNTLKDEDLLYLTSSDIALSTTYGSFKNQIKQSIAFDFLPSASTGDGLIYEGGQWNSRKLNYSDLDGIPIPSPFNYNIDVTFIENGNTIIVNPNALTQSYVIGDVTFEINDTYNFLIPSLLDSNRQRIDFVVLKPNNLIEYRTGVENQIPLSPSISGDEIILLQLLLADTGSIVSENTSSNLNFTNGLTLTGETVSLGGNLTSNSSIITNGFSLSIGSANFGVDTEISNLSLTGLLKDNFGVLPSVDGQVLTFENGSLIWGSPSNSELNNLRTLTGTSIGSSDLGSLTGSIVTDNVSIKTALQELESSIEAINPSTNLSLGTVTLTTVDINSDTGTNVTIPQATATEAGVMGTVDKTKLDFLSITQAVDLDTLETNTGNLITLSGVAANDPDLGTFSGNIITDNRTVKEALQEVETAIELVPTKILFNENLETVYYLEGYIGNTTSLSVIHADTTNIFSSINYAFKEFGGVYSTDTTDLTAFNSALAGIGVSTTFDIRITVEFQPGVTSGGIDLNIKTS